MVLVLRTSGFDCRLCAVILNKPLVTLDRLRTLAFQGRDTRAQAAHQEKLSVRALVEKAGSPRISHAWDVTFKEIDRILDYCTAARIPAAIVIFPYAFQLDSPETLGGPQADIARYAASRHVPCLDLLPLLAGKMRREGTPVTAHFSDDVHPSLEGSRVMARMIADLLEKTPPLARSLGAPARGLPVVPTTLP